MKRKMAFVSSPEKIEYIEREIPQLKENEILIKVEMAAICGSDLHLYKGLHPYVKLPNTIGHELVGRVVAVGNKVDSIYVRDIVVPEPVVICGKCDFCKEGNYSYCKELSFQYRKGQAGFTDYFIAEGKWAHKIPNGISLKEAVLTEPLSVAVHTVSKINNLLGKDVVVFGAGPIGLLIIQLCKIMGCNEIIAVDIVDKKIELANQLGATISVNPIKEDVLDVANKLTDSYGVDVVFEATGSVPCITKCVEIVKKGGTIVQAGITPNNTIDYPYSKIVAKEIVIKGSQGYCHDFKTAIKILDKKLIDIKSIISHEYKWKDIQEAFNIVADKDIFSSKVILNYGDDYNG